MMTNAIQKATTELQLAAEGARNGADRGCTTMNKDNSHNEKK